MSTKKVFSHLRNDIPASIVVFLVALPLCLGIALASGAPFFSGILAGIVGGIVIGSLSGSNLSVSGPAAGLAALVLAAITNIGDYPLFLCSVFIAGLLQLLMSFAKLGGIANYFPSSVIKGMLTSIGILITAKQIPHALGYDKNEKGQLSELLPFGDMHELFQPFQHVHIGVVVLCIVSLIIIIVSDTPKIKRLINPVPGALVAVIVSVILNEIFTRTSSSLAVDSDHLVALPEGGSIKEFFSFFTFPNFKGFFESKVILFGVMIAIIASVETLLCIEAVDKMDPERNVTNTNRELMAQGVGNCLSGLIGGLPITSVIVRSTANLHASAKTKLSTIIHGFLLLVCVISIPGLLNKIPLSSLAAILILTGYRLAKVSVFKQMIKNGKYQYIPFFVTILTILLIDLFGVFPSIKGYGLLIGVFAGLITASMAILHGNLKNSYYFHRQDHHEGNTISIRLSEEVSFLNKASIRETLDHMPENASVCIDASNTRYIDFDVLELIKEFRDIKAPLKNIKLSLINFKEEYKIENTTAVASSH